MTDTFDVFLSHAHTDAEVVELLGIQLEDEAQLRVWLDKWILVPGEHWQQEMAKGLDEAKTCAVCIGRDTPKGWFREEIERALNRQTKDDSFRVIPVILPNGDPNVVDDFLELRTWVEFKQEINEGYALHVLASGIKGESPGRNPYQSVKADAKFDQVRMKLKRIRLLRSEQLIDDDIALDAQRRVLLDDIIGK